MYFWADDPDLWFTAVNNMYDAIHIYETLSLCPCLADSAHIPTAWFGHNLSLRLEAVAGSNPSPFPSIHPIQSREKRFEEAWAGLWNWKGFKKFLLILPFSHNFLCALTNTWQFNKCL